MRSGRETITAAMMGLCLAACGGRAQDTGLGAGASTDSGTGAGGPSAGGGVSTGAGGVPGADGSITAGAGGRTMPGAGGIGSGDATGAGGAADVDGGTVASGGASGFDDTPVAPAPGECERTLEFHARNDATGTPYTVGASSIDLTNCFSFHVDLGGPAQGLQFRPRVDSTQVIHHFLLYVSPTAQADGVNSPCLGLHPDAVLLAGWAPGTGDWNLPQHVGVDLGGGDFILEVHYNNLGAATLDSSGFDVCATTQLRPETATVSWLGTEQIFIPPQSVAEAASNCTPNTTEPIHILRSWPRMNRYGRQMTAVIHRASGSTENLFDVPFDFNYQFSYDTPAILNPGDFITTTCRYENTSSSVVTFGESAGSELCYNMTVAYPAGALASSGLHTNSCSN